MARVDIYLYRRRGNSRLSRKDFDYMNFYAQHKSKKGRKNIIVMGSISYETPKEGMEEYIIQIAKAFSEYKVLDLREHNGKLPPNTIGMQPEKVSDDKVAFFTQSLERRLINNGNGNNVRVSLDGKPVDLSSFPERVLEAV